MFFSLATVLAAALSVSAQTTHTITVAPGGNLVYSPSNITASPGDLVTFVFGPKNHTVTQSTFTQPCTQLTNTSATPNIVGISSGYVPVSPNATEVPTWTFTVTDSNPLWFFCLQATHCQKGMVFSINATPEKPYDQFLAAAKATNASVPNPVTNGAATPANGTTGTTTIGPDFSSLSGSSTAAPTGTQTGTGSSSTQTGASPSQSSPGAALPNVKVPSLAIGALSVFLGLTL